MKTTNPNDLVSKYYNILFNFPNYFDDDLVKELDRIFKSKGIVSILEFGSGIGNPSLGLANRGYKVVGIDSSKEMCRKAINNAREINSPATFLNTTIDTLNKDMKFDCIICHDSLYYFEYEELTKLLEKLKSHLGEKRFFYIANKRCDSENNFELRKKKKTEVGLL